MRNNAQMLTSTLVPVFVKKHHEVFLAAGLGIVSSFNIGQNQINSILRGHWGKKFWQIWLQYSLKLCRTIYHKMWNISCLSKYATKGLQKATI